jgi:hypothetical protein
MLKFERSEVYPEAEESADTSWVDLAEGKTGAQEAAAPEQTPERAQPVEAALQSSTEADAARAQAMTQAIQEGQFEKAFFVSREQQIQKAEDQIKTALSIQGIFSALDELGSIEGSSQTYLAKDVKETIGRVFLGEESLFAVTRSHGLRDAVEALYYTKNAQNFEQLYRGIEKLGTIQGGSKEYSAEELTGLIDKVRSGELTPSYVTATYGIRSAVERLLG